jgi:hypothetical protein
MAASLYPKQPVCYLIMPDKGPCKLSFGVSVNFPPLFDNSNPTHASSSAGRFIFLQDFGMGHAMHRGRRLSTLLHLSLACSWIFTVKAVMVDNVIDHASSKNNTGGGRRLNVFGWPDRRHISDRDTWPGRVVGKLEFPDRQYCTATLVGPSLILTARHW